MIEKFGKKIHVQKVVYQVMLFHEHIFKFHLENDWLFDDILLTHMDMNKYDIDLVPF
jgi:hypothetical protein